MPGDVRSTLVWTLRDEVTAQARKINSSLDQMGVKAKGTSGILGELGNVTGGLINPTTLATTAIFGAGAALVGTVKAAIDQEEAYKRLDTSLKTNAKNWDGNTRKVDDNLVAIEGWSGFAKDDLRNSMTLLVGATHDVGKAQDVLSTAMDLARFKGIGLQDATEALTRVEGGSYRILKSLGIQLPATATQVEALAAVEAVAAGQAKDYGDSHAAALDKIVNAWNDAIANVGGGIVDLGSLIGETWDNIQGPGKKLFAGAQQSSKDFTTATLHDQLNIRDSIDKTIAKVGGLEREYAQATLSIPDAIGLFLASREKPKTPAQPRSGPVKARASGGPVLPGETYTVGEHGPETLRMYSGGGGTVIPGGSGSGFTIQGVSEAQIVAMVDRGLYFKLARASASATRK